MLSYRFHLAVVFASVGLVAIADRAAFAEDPCDCTSHHFAGTRRNTYIEIQPDILNVTPIAASGWAKSYAGVNMAATEDPPWCCPSIGSRDHFFFQDSDLFYEESSNLILDSIHGRADASGLPDNFSIGTTTQAIAYVHRRGMNFKNSFGASGPDRYLHYRSVTTYYNILDDLSCKHTFQGDSGVHAKSQGELVAHFNPSSPEQPTIRIMTKLRRSCSICISEDCDEPCTLWMEQHHPTTPLPPSHPQLRFVTITIVANYGGRTSDTEILQGLVADVLDDESLYSVKMGIFDSPEFAEDPAPDGVEVFGERTIFLDPPEPGLVSMTITCDTDAFNEYDGDVNADGSTCPDDYTLMLSLTATGVGFGESAYTPRADFNLDGMIDATDWPPFERVYAALPDCNKNDSPDECDIALGTSDDLNENGIPDECEGRPGDMNCSGIVDAMDIQGFVMALVEPMAYSGWYPDCDPTLADVDGSETVDSGDVEPFVVMLLGES